MIVEPLHQWYVGRGKARSTVMLCAADVLAVEAYSRPGVPLLFLTELWVPAHARGQGYAHSLLLAATSWADAAKTDLWLYIAPFGVEPRADANALMRLYRKYGFKHKRSVSSPDTEMVRRYVRSNH